MIQGAEALAEDLGPVRVDAAVGRHIKRRDRDPASGAPPTGKLATMVIVQLGNNGPFRAGQFDAVMDAARATCRSSSGSTSACRATGRRTTTGSSRPASRSYPNARLVDWYSATDGRPELFWKDGYHPRPKGAELYADLIAAAVADDGYAYRRLRRQLAAADRRAEDDRRRRRSRRS